MGGFIYGWAYIWNGESVSKLVGLYMGDLYSGGLYSEVYVTLPPCFNYRVVM